jgi:hypothetical protein
MTSWRHVNEKAKETGEERLPAGGAQVQWATVWWCRVGYHRRSLKRRDEMSFDELKTQFHGEWQAIAQARHNADAQIRRLSDLLMQEGRDKGSFDSEDIALVVFGSLARAEWTTGSDLDWTLLIDGGADHEHANTAYRVGELLKGAGFPQPGRTGTFGKLAFSHNIIHQLGGSDDSNRNTTQRLLLLLESRAVNRQDAYDRVILGILRRYLQNDFRPFRLKVPRFLLNDLHRYWRTMCVDYASKYRERAAEGWAIRNIKLRMSRKLIFAAGLVTCYSCDPRLVEVRDPVLAKNPTPEGMVDYLRGFVRQTPLDILCEALLRWSKPETAGLVLGPYDAFLSRLDDAEKRRHLEGLTPERSVNDELFQELQAHTQSFGKGLECLFFDDHPTLAALNRDYGVF